jgi:hypothetical protein
MSLEDLMKAIMLVALLLLSVPAWAATAPAEYSVNVHVSSDRFLSYCSPTVPCVFTVQLLHVTILGKKYVIQDTASKQGLLPLGNYKAMSAKPKDGLAVFEFLLPDNKTEKFTVVGQSE